jgi:hypothetical protein
VIARRQETLNQFATARRASEWLDGLIPLWQFQLVDPPNLVSPRVVRSKE